MAACFLTNVGMALALTLPFLQPTWWLLPLAAGSALLTFAMPKLHPWFFARHGDRVIEPGTKGACAALLVLMVLAEVAQNYAILPAFLLGVAVSRVFASRRTEQERFRVVAFTLLVPFFSIKTGMNVWERYGPIWA